MALPIAADASTKNGPIACWHTYGVGYSMFPKQHLIRRLCQKQVSYIVR